MPVLSTRAVAAPDASPVRWLAVLHGIYGAGRNWASVARALVSERPEWGVVLVDLREHGSSRGFPGPHTLEAVAADLDGVEAPGPVAAILGHSFGGKVAVLRAQADARIEQTWIVDSTPESREPGGGAWDMLNVLWAVPESFEERGDAVAALRARGVAEPVAVWMTTNLERADGGYRWAIDLEDMETLLRDFFRVDLWSAVETPREGLELHFIRATESAVLGADAVARIRGAGERTGRVFLHDVPGGHWLNADNPDALVALLARHLRSHRFD